MAELFRHAIAEWHAPRHRPGGSRGWSRRMPSTRLLWMPTPMLRRQRAC